MEFSAAPLTTLKRISTLLGLGVGLLTASVGIRMLPGQGSGWLLVLILVVAVCLSITASALIDSVWGRYWNSGSRGTAE